MKKTNGFSTFLFCAATLFAFGSVTRAAGAVYDLSADFSTNANPGGAWSYGWKSTLDGAFTLYARHGFELQDGGGQWDYWLKPGGGASAVYHNSGTITITNNGGQGVYP